jgi:hypothetical protein
MKIVTKRAINAAPDKDDDSILTRAAGVVDSHRSVINGLPGLDFAHCQGLVFIPHGKTPECQHSVEAGKIRLMMKPSPSSQRGMMAGEA